MQPPYDHDGPRTKSNKTKNTTQKSKQMSNTDPTKKLKTKENIHLFVEENLLFCSFHPWKASINGSS